MVKHKSRAQHPLVAAFVHTDAPLIYLLRNIPEPRGQVTELMLQMRESLMGMHSIDDALRRAEEMPSDIVEPDLYLLFLGLWAEMCGQVGRLAQMRLIVNRMAAIASDDSPVELRAHIIDFEGFLAGASGDVAARERAFNDVLTCLSRRSPRYKIAVLQRALFLAQLGRETEVDSELQEILEGDYDVPFSSRVAMVRFVQYVETGRLHDAQCLVDAIESEPPLIANYAERYRTSAAALRLMRNGGSSDPTPLPENVQVIERLLSRTPDEALTLSRVLAGRSVAPVAAQVGFEAFNLIRTELAVGNGDLARRLLDDRHERGNAHYLDDFFLARIALLEGNRSAAARHLGHVFDAAEKYHALGRLDFEIRLATELRAVDLFPLGRAADKLRASTAASSPRTVAPRPQPHGIDRLVGNSAAMSAIRESVLRFAPLDAPVLITGATGTGKELVARALHESGPRASAPFIPINCGAIAETLLESELFGHERGAFTGASKAHRGLFEEARDGTVFLDEIGEISPRLQVVLLRVLESSEIRPVGSSRTRTVRCRIVAATNADLDSAVAAKTFRKDSLFRLRRLEIRIPTLKERPDDVVPLANHFLASFRNAGARPIMSPELKAALLWHDWPGNARELRNCIERMCLVKTGQSAFGLEDLEIGAGERSILRSESRRSVGPIPDTGREAREEETILRNGSSARRRLDRIRELFRRHGELRRSEIAQLLGISAVTITKDLKCLAIDGFIQKVTPNASPQTHYFVLREQSDAASP